MAVASRTGMPSASVSAGTSTKPPPTPKKPVSRPTASPAATTRTTRRAVGRPRAASCPFTGVAAADHEGGDPQDEDGEGEQQHLRVHEGVQRGARHAGGDARRRHRETGPPADAARARLPDHRDDRGEADDDEAAGRRLAGALAQDVDQRRHGQDRAARAERAHHEPDQEPEGPGREGGGHGATLPHPVARVTGPDGVGARHRPHRALVGAMTRSDVAAVRTSGCGNALMAPWAAGRRPGPVRRWEAGADGQERCDSSGGSGRRSPGGSPVRFGIIGAGNIGATLTRRLRALGHDVAVANSRGPETLSDLARETGARAVAVEQAADGADVVVVTVPQRAVPSLPAPALQGRAPGAVVVDTGNYYPQRDGRIDALESGTPHSVWVSEQLGVPVVKAFNTIESTHLLQLGRPRGSAGRIALPVAGDDEGAKETVTALVEELGFDAVDAGGLDESWRQEPGTPVYGADLDADGVREGLAAAAR